MPDVTGLPCVLCSQPIESLFDGVFCAECRGPYHHKCFGGAAGPRTKGRCGYCGGDLQAATQRGRQTEAKSTSVDLLGTALRLRRESPMVLLKATLILCGLACVVSGVFLARMPALAGQDWWENMALAGTLVLGGVVICALMFFWIRPRRTGPAKSSSP
jgi:hypothetical protein